MSHLEYPRIQRSTSQAAEESSQALHKLQDSSKLTKLGKVKLEEISWTKPKDMNKNT